MTPKQMQRDINKTGQALELKGYAVSINWKIPYVSVDRQVKASDEPESIFYVQGDEAGELLDEAANAVKEFDVLYTDFILWRIVSAVTR